MGEQAWLPGLYPVQPVPCPPVVASKSKVFPFRPTHEEIIQRAQRAAQRRGAKSPVVANPTREYRLSPAGDFFQGEIAATVQPPATHPLTHRLGRFVAHGRRKTHEEFSLAALRRPGTKRIAQEIKALFRKVAVPTCILAVNDLRLVRMKFKATLREALL